MMDFFRYKINKQVRKRKDIEVNLWLLKEPILMFAKMAIRLFDAPSFCSLDCY